MTIVIKYVSQAAVKKALAEGAKVEFIGQYREGLETVLRVTKPSHWEGDNWNPRKETFLECEIPADKVDVTIAWVRRNHPKATLEIIDSAVLLECCQLEVMAPGHSVVTRLCFLDAVVPPFIPLEFAEMHRFEMPFQPHYAFELDRRGRALVNN
jgi:hypothetical protein